MYNAFFYNLYVKLLFFFSQGTSCSNNEVFEEPKSEEKHTSLLKQEDKENNSNCTRRQILLPTEHGDTTNKSFRRNRSLYSKNSPRMDHKSMNFFLFNAT